MDTKFGTNVCELLRENQLGGGGKITPPPTKIRVNVYFLKKQKQKQSRIQNIFKTK